MPLSRARFDGFSRLSEAERPTSLRAQPGRKAASRRDFAEPCRASIYWCLRAESRDSLSLGTRRESATEPAERLATQPICERPDGRAVMAVFPPCATRVQRGYCGMLRETDDVGNDMSAGEPALVEDFSRSATWADPYAAYSRWREQSPVLARMPFVLPDGSEIETFNWLLLRHREVCAVLRDHETFSSEPPQIPGIPVPRLPLVQDDPPRHSVLRRLVSKAFTARRVAQLEPWIRQMPKSCSRRWATGKPRLWTVLRFRCRSE